MKPVQHAHAPRRDFSAVSRSDLIEATAGVHAEEHERRALRSLMPRR